MQVRNIQICNLSNFPKIMRHQRNKTTAHPDRKFGQVFEAGGHSRYVFFPQDLEEEVLGDVQTQAFYGMLDHRGDPAAF